MSAIDQTACVAERVPRGTGSLITLKGVIDQRFDAMSFSQQSSGTTILDLDGVSRITSFGVREWNKAIQLVSSGYLGFVNVRPAMVMQFNVVAGVSGNGQIVTLYVPFICGSCQHAFEKLYDLREVESLISEVETAPPPCPLCSMPSELDELPSVYFGFVQRQGPPTVPHDFEVVLDGSSAAITNTAPVVDRVQQEIEGNETYLWLNGPLDAGLGLRRLTDSLEGTVVVILQGITECGPDAGFHLSRVFHYGRGPLYFARVPVAMRSVLLSGGVTPHIVSWWVSQACTACYSVSSFELNSTAAEQSCSKCSALLPADPLLTRLAGELVPMPSTVVTSLTGRTGARKAVNRGAFLSRFEVLKKIGSGGMGEVYLARQQGLGGFEKLVALKRILTGLVKTPNAIEMFLSEARLAARLSHRNIVQIFDVGHERGEFYIALEYVDGLDLRTLYDLCAQSGQMVPPAIAMQLIADAAAGLSAAHTHVEPDGTRHVIVHRDVSPHNILISSKGEAKITDFGIAKMESDEDKTPESVTKGKLWYLAPEQVNRIEQGKLEPRSDVFSLGVVLYQTLTLQHPFAGTSAYDTLKAVLERPVPPVSQFREHLPLIDAIIARATAKSLDARYQSAAAMRADLIAAIGSPTPDIAAWLQPLLKLRSVVNSSASGTWSQTVGREAEVTKARSFEP